MTWQLSSSFLPCTFVHPSSESSTLSSILYDSDVLALSSLFIDDIAAVASDSVMKASALLSLLCMFSILPLTGALGLTRRPKTIVATNLGYASSQQRCHHRQGPRITASATTNGCANIDSDTEFNPYDDPEPRPLPLPTVAPKERSTLKRRRLNQLKNGRTKPNMVPDDPKEEWEWFYQRLQLRYKNRWNDEGPSDPIEEALLRNWMANQRKAFMKTLGVLNLADKANWGTEYLPLAQKERLDQAGFHWGHLQPTSLTNDVVYSADFQSGVRTKYKDWIWSPIFESLVKWKKEHGHTNVPLANEDGLGTWTAQQRSIRWDMPQRRREKLDSISFDWNWKDVAIVSPINKTKVVLDGAKVKEVRFASRVSQLKEFRRANGHCVVPSDYGDVPGLGVWVKSIQGRRRDLSPGSIANLEKIGLVFDPDEVS